MSALEQLKVSVRFLRFQVFKPFKYDILKSRKRLVRRYSVWYYGHMDSKFLEIIQIYKLDPIRYRSEVRLHQALPQNVLSPCKIGAQF